jgi:hypothetical protein
MVDLFEYVEKNLGNSVYLNCEHCGRERWVLLERVQDGRIVWVCEICADDLPEDGTIAHLSDYIILD